MPEPERTFSTRQLVFLMGGGLLIAFWLGGDLTTGTAVGIAVLTWFTSLFFE